MIGGLGAPRLGDPASSRPEHLAALVVWLATDAAANVNGGRFWSSRASSDLSRVDARATAREGGWDLDAPDRFAPEHLTADLQDEFAGVK